MPRLVQLLATGIPRLDPAPRCGISPTQRSRSAATQPAALRGLNFSHLIPGEMTDRIENLDAHSGNSTQKPAPEASFSIRQQPDIVPNQRHNLLLHLK